MSGDEHARRTLHEEWECGECGYTETAPTDEIAGRPIKKTVGEGHRTEVIETAVCPECKSANWHSKGVRDAFMGGS